MSDASAVDLSLASDRECLNALRRGQADALQTLVRRYLPLAHGVARRQSPDDDAAAEITCAVFLALARRARRLPRRTVLADWLFTVAHLAARKREPSRLWPWRWFRARPPRRVSGSELWTGIAPRFDRELRRLRRRRRQAFILRHVVRLPPATAAAAANSRERRVDRRARNVLCRLARRWRKLGCANAEALAREIADHACPHDEALCERISSLTARALHQRPRELLARRVLASLAFKRWRRRALICCACLFALLIAGGATAWWIDSRSGFSRSFALLIEWSVRREAKSIRGLAVPAKPWPTKVVATQVNVADLRSAAEIYRTTNIWPVHLSFSAEAWNALQPKRIAPLSHFMVGDGTVLLRNPGAQRSGIAGVLGFDFNWAHADFEFAAAQFTNAGVRIKGNGTFLSSLYGEKRAFKVDLNKFAEGRRLGGCDEFTLNNLVVDASFLSDALAYEFCRDAGVPAPRTAFAYVSVSVAEKWQRKPLGLYALVEPVDAKFAAAQFSSKRTPIFKPVTYELFKFLGEDWGAYAKIYDLKTKATPEQQQRVIEFCRLLTTAGDVEFAARLAEFLDLDAFARFLAAQVLLSNYDSLFSNGQNFYVYLDPRTDKLGFIPWDFDLAWGAFFLLGTTEERERASIWHPWVGENRFLERVMSVDAFRKVYRVRLEEFLSTLFLRDRLFPRVDLLAQTIRPAIAAESDFRLARFDQAVTVHWQDPPPRRGSQGSDRPVHQIKRFIEKRSHFVRQQLDGRSRGMILHRSK